MEEFEITVLNKDLREKKIDRITEEIPLTMEVNGKELATLLCTPADLKDLVVGFLYTSGIIEAASSVKSIVLDEERWKAMVDVGATGLSEEMVFRRIYTSGCGKGVIFHSSLDLLQRIRMNSGFEIDGERITGYMRDFQRRSEEFKATGGVHSAALAGREEILIFKEDLGRHNAIDKVIGEALFRRIDFDEAVILTSGRISSEIISKVLRARVPVVVSAGAPTNQAVKLARQVHLTLVGFARASRMNIYSGEERII